MKEIDIEYLPFYQVPEMGYIPDFDGFELSDKINEVLQTLTQREERVVRLRFGIGTDGEHTLEEIAQHLSISRERVRQIVAKALRKLRRPARSKKLSC